MFFLKYSITNLRFVNKPGTSDDWISYAYINWHISVFNDNWCNYVSAQLHEIGHNLNLAHSSSLSDTYGDTSSGKSYLNTNYVYILLC